MSVAVLVACSRDTATSPPAVALDAIPGNGVTARQLNAELGVSKGRYLSFRRDRPAHMERYVVGFRGRGTDSRDWDRTVLRAHGAVEIYYFVGFRAAAVYLTSDAAARLHAHLAVAWISADTESNRTYATSETTPWPYTVHGFGDAYSDNWRGSGARVAVIGNGVECSLDDLEGLCAGGVEITGPPDEDGGSSHDTFITSIIGALVSNGEGIKGGAPDISLYSVRASELVSPDTVTPAMTCANHAVALEAAADPDGSIQADVINDSYGAPGETSTQCPAVDSVLIYAHAVNVVVVASVGNGGYHDVYWPAEHQYTIAVSSVKQSPLKLSTTSNYGPEVDIAAGGESVQGLNRLGTVQTKTGTSFAVPQVVAAVALLIDQKLTLEGCKPRIREIESALFDNTQAPADPFEEEWYGSGVLDVWAALSADWMTVPCLERQRKEN